MARGRRQRRRATTRAPYGKWTPEIKGQFLAVLRETGNAREGYRRIGHHNMFRKRRRRDAEFRREWAEAVAEADAGLRGAEGPFVGAETQSPTLTPDPSPASGRGEKMPTRPKPGPKRIAAERGVVIRRIRGGRVQIALAREYEMDEEQEAAFLALLRATGNFHASALAVGFQPASLHQRARRWPAFERACDAAIAEADIDFNYKLVAHAHRLLRAPGEAEAAGIAEEQLPFDPETAMRIIGFIDKRKNGRAPRGPRGAPPERTFDDAVASILAKIEAIERHEALMKERAARGGENEGAQPPAP